jgi:GGDEF domain-containing protein
MVSLGFVSLYGKAQVFQEEFLKNADEALYKAECLSKKCLSKNRIEEYRRI